jgi:hypothetical protein
MLGPPLLLFGVTGFVTTWHWRLLFARSTDPCEAHSSGAHIAPDIGAALHRDTLAVFS